MRSKNSKFGLIFTIVCNAAIVLCFAIGFFLLFFKIDLPDKLDKNTFIDYMEAKGCKINDVLAREFNTFESINLSKPLKMVIFLSNF